MQEEYRKIFEKFSQLKYREEYAWFQACGNPELRHGLMVIGRAVNGWKPFFPGKSKFEDLYETDNDIFPDGNVAGYFNEYGYNIFSSAFWRTVYKVASGLFPCTENDFGKYLCYSNLYKVAVVQANPTAVMKRIQLPECIEILKKEIQYWQPEYVLFLTDWSWAEPFLTSPILQYTSQDTPYNQLKSCGVFSDGCRVAVIPHPQGKNENQLASQAVSFFKDSSIF